MFTALQLEPAQEDLLFQLVEADRSLPSAQRQPFVFAQTFGRSAIDHPAFGKGGLDIFRGDLETLKWSGMVAFTSDTHFYLTPTAQKYYVERKKDQKDVAKSIEANIVGTLTTADFELRHPKSSSKWREAYFRLWDRETSEGTAVIGHLCREASQEFATELVNQHAPGDVDKDIAKVKNRVRAVVSHRRKVLGSRDTAWVDALLSYWSALVDLIQKHEHAAQNEGPPLTWEDSRRLVYQCANVFFEIDRLVRPS